MRAEQYISNKVLRRLVERHIGKEGDIPEQYTALFTAIDNSFEHLENDRQMLERAMELSSDELTQANTRLREEAKQSTLLLRKLEESLIALGLFDSSMSDMDILTIAATLRQEIDKRIEAEKQSVALLRRTQQVIDTSLDAVVISDEYGHINGWNAAAERIFGWVGNDILGKRITETIIPKKFASVVERSLIHYRRTRNSTVLGKRIELTAVNAQGVSFPIELTITATDIEEGCIFTSFIRDISERKQAEQHLIEAKLQAESANRAKSAFLSSMSHELRTPLNSIIGFAQILMKERSIPEQQKGFLRIMYNSGNHLLDMINDILDISKIEAGQMELMIDTVDLHNMMKEIDDIVRVRCLSKGLRLTLEVQNDVPRYVLSDAKRLKQVLFNLISNAIKFTASGGITIRIHHAGQTEEGEMLLRFSVEDTGRGIPREQLASIFRPFKQVNGMYSEGTGLGLAICSRIISMMRGSISVDSTVGVGSTFVVHVPFRMAETPAGADTPVSIPRCRIKDGKQPKVLIVDDIENNRSVVRLSLEDIGFVCYEACDGIEALEQCATVQPDVILMDLQMPRMDGISAMKAIRTRYGTALPVIALTASGFDGKREELIAAGFNEYIRKPFREEELLYALEHIAGISFDYADTLMPEQNTENILAGIIDFINDLPAEMHRRFLDALHVQNLSEMEKIVHELGDVPSQHQSALSKLLRAIESFDVGTLIRLSESYS